jgi:hypothetical protein
MVIATNPDPKELPPDPTVSELNARPQGNVRRAAGKNQSIAIDG